MRWAFRFFWRAATAASALVCILLIAWCVRSFFRRDLIYFNYSAGPLYAPTIRENTGSSWRLVAARESFFVQRDHYEIYVPGKVATPLKVERLSVASSPATGSGYPLLTFLFARDPNRGFPMFEGQIVASPAGSQSRTTVVFPFWFLILLTALPPALLWLIRARGSTRKRIAPGLCPACGYDLRATPVRCPECGRPVATMI